MRRREQAEGFGGRSKSQVKEDSVDDRKEFGFYSGAVGSHQRALSRDVKRI